jgi:hypothetical protein
MLWKEILRKKGLILGLLMQPISLIGSLKRGERHYLGDVQKEESHPFAIREEEGTCAYAVDLEALEAKPQSELIYENRAKRRVVVQSCRPSAGGMPVRITATQKGCGYVHQLPPMSG